MDKSIPLYKANGPFVFASDPDGPAFRILRGDGMYLWIERIGERGKYSAHIGSRVIEVDETHTCEEE